MLSSAVSFETVGLVEHLDPTLLVFFETCLILLFGFFAYELAQPTPLPSFVIAIFVGMLLRKPLLPLIGDAGTLGVLTTLGAALILFGGGLETPFARFRVLVGPILSIAFIGTLLTAALLSFFLLPITSLFGTALPIGAAVLLGAALASTDPAAIIPSLKSLFFPNPRVKDIAVSESAINDVVGAVLTGVFLSVLLESGHATSIGSVYMHLLSAETGIEVLKEVVIGFGVGIAGFFLLLFWSRWKPSLSEGGEADAALFMAIPLLCYLVAVAFHGSGFLAVFICGLLFQMEEHVSHVSHYFNHTIEGFMKPLIFMLLGATVDVEKLLQVAGPGILAGLAFIFIIRPLAVFITLSPFMRGKHSFSVRELLFMSFVRETGVIPAVLLMGLGASGIPGTDKAVLIGLWVILLTLVVQPPLTPLVAQRLGIAGPAPKFPKRTERGPTAVLCSRGHSFLDRLRTVVDWADRHHVQNVTLLHCPESRYTEAFLAQVKIDAGNLFEAVNTERRKEGKSDMQFEFLGRPGTLQENIEQLIASDDISIIFVGSKMLDYRIEDVKRLQAPLIFLA